MIDSKTYKIGAAVVAIASLIQFWAAVGFSFKEKWCGCAIMLVGGFIMMQIFVGMTIIRKIDTHFYELQEIIKNLTSNHDANKNLADS